MMIIVRTVLLGVLLTLGLSAATRSDVNTIEAAEHIRYLSQKIARDYLYLYSRPQRNSLRTQLHTMIEELKTHFATIDASTQDNDTKDLLKYLEYNTQSMRELLTENITKEQARQMLDYSEILLEGADSIAREHRYPFNAEETMLMNIKKYEYLIERLGKFYMASQLGALSQSNRKKMKQSIEALTQGLETIRAYRYPETLEKQKRHLDLFWKADRHFLRRAYDMFVPTIVVTTNDAFERILGQFALYHSKRQ
jgi:uncharacterized protein YsxB (DUF464 family)